MYKTWIVFRHYFYRAMIDWLGLLFLMLLPTAMLVINSIVISHNMEAVFIDGYNVAMTGNAAVFAVMFQLFGGIYLNEWLYDDFKGDKRWRLFAAPITQNQIVFSAAIASWLFTAALGLSLVAISAVFFNAYWENFLFWIPALILLSAISQFMWVIIGFLVKKKRTAQTIGFITVFAMQALAGFLINLGERVSQITEKIPTPLTAGFRAIIHSGLDSEFNERNTNVAAQNLLILCAWLAVLVIVAVILGRRRPI